MTEVQITADQWTQLLANHDQMIQTLGNLIQSLGYVFDVLFFTALMVGLGVGYIVGQRQKG